MNIRVLKIRGMYGFSLVSLASLSPSSAHHATNQAHELTLDGPGWAQDHHLDGPEWARGLHLDGPLWAPDHQFYGPKLGPGKFMVWLPWCLQNYARWMQRFICHDCGSVLDEWKQSWLEFWQNTLLLVVRHIWHLYLSLSLSLSVALYLCLYLSISLSISFFLSLFFCWQADEQ